MDSTCTRQKLYDLYGTDSGFTGRVYSYSGSIQLELDGDADIDSDLCDIIEMTIIVGNLKADTKRNGRIIPIDVPDQQFFGSIINLFTDLKYIASHRESAFYALICMCNPDLVERATGYLLSIRGTWLDFHYDPEESEFIFPSSMDRDIIMFLLEWKQFLTQEEIEVLLKFQNANHLYDCLNTEITIKVANLKHDKLPCVLFSCTKCNKHRPIYTQVVGQTICTFCSQDRGFNVPSSELNVFTYRCIKCNCLFQDTQVIPSRLEPICRFCMKQQPVPSVKCILCNLNHIIPNNKLPANFKCHLCLIPPTTNILSITVNDLLSVNYKHVLKKMNDYMDDTRVDLENISLSLSLISSHLYEKTQLFTSDRREILNVREVIQDILSMFSSGRSTQLKECFSCSVSLPSAMFLRICDNLKCTEQSCISCCYKWLSDVQRGQLVDYSHCCCPYCRQVFSATTSLIDHLPISELNMSENIEDHYMAWCKKCNYLKSYSKRECHQGIPLVKDFTCTDCQEKISIFNKDRIVTCNHCNSFVCKVLILNGVKNTQCNHVICERCSYHVCAYENCGNAFTTSHECYTHMTSQHGSWYDS